MSHWIAEIDERLEGARQRHDSAPLETRAVVEETLLIARAIGYGRGIASATLVRGMCFLIQGKHEEAFAEFLTALRLSRELSQDSLIADSLHGMGIIHSGRAEYQEALCCYRGALRLRHDIGDQRGQITALNSMGSLHTRLGNFGEAIASYDNSLCIARHIGDSRSEMIAANSLGMLRYERQDFAGAVAELECAVLLAERINDRLYPIMSLTHLCSILTETEQYERAEAAGQKALDLALESGSLTREAAVLQALGRLYARMGRTEEAAQTLVKVLAYSATDTKIQDVPALYLELGNIAGERGAFSSAEALYHQGLDIAADSTAKKHANSLNDALAGLHDRAA